MKGLLLKDFYMAAKYCRACLLCGMIPVNLLAYDERSRWLEYSGTLPYTKAQIVSGKYLVGIIVQGPCSSPWASPRGCG